MKFRNDSGMDRTVFNMGFPEGDIVEVPDDLEPSMIHYLRGLFTVVKDADHEPEAQPTTYSTGYEDFEVSEERIEKYEDFTVPELRDIVRDRGLTPSNRSKSELIDLLEGDDGQSENE